VLFSAAEKEGLYSSSATRPRATACVACFVAKRPSDVGRRHCWRWFGLRGSVPRQTFNVVREALKKRFFAKVLEGLNVPSEG